MVNRERPIRPPTRVFEDPTPHPSECRSFRYSEDMRLLAVTNRLEGHDGPENQHIAHLRNTFKSVFFFYKKINAYFLRFDVTLT